MKKNTLYLIIAIVSLYIAWRSLRINKDIRDAQKSMTEPGTEPADPNAVPITPVNRFRIPRTNPGNVAPAVMITTEERDKVVTTYENCPYCGTRNAEIKRTYRNGVLVQTDVFCNNKSCPGQVAAGKAGSRSMINTSKFVSVR